MENPVTTRFPLSLVLVLSVAALGPSQPVGAQTAPREIVVVMDNMNFGRLPSDAKVGDVIVWDNRDTVLHTATARDGSFDVRIDPGKRATQTLTKAGTFAFYCILHPTMRGTLKVAAS